MGGAFNIRFPLDARQQRGAYRASARGLQLRAEDDGAVYDIRNISRLGCRLTAPACPYVVGRTLGVRLEAGGRVLLAGFQARVLRALSDGDLACSFQGLTPQQECVLDKLVLEIQKRQIARVLGMTNGDSSGTKG